MKLRSSYMIALAFLMLTAFSRRAKADNVCLGHDQEFGPYVGDQVLYTTLTDQYGWCSRDWQTGSVSSILLFQHDGNFVLYNRDYKPLWATNTNEHWWKLGGYELDLQGDSNVVVYDANGDALWASGTDQYEDAFLEVLDGYWGIWFNPGWKNQRRYR